MLFGQVVESKKEYDLGINYYGELAFRPGLEIDFGYPILFTKAKPTEKNITFTKALYLRPAISYYYFPVKIDHFLLATKLNYLLKFQSSKNQRQFSVEPYIKAGYLRTQYRQGVYETTTSGFEAKESFGTNSLALGSGIDLTGSLSKDLLWLIGFDYFAEFTDDSLILHRFVGKIGTRIKL